MNDEQIIDKIVELTNSRKLNWTYNAGMFKANIGLELNIKLYDLSQNILAQPINGEKKIKLNISTDHAEQGIILSSDKITKLFDDLTTIRNNETAYKYKKEQEALMSKIEELLG